MRRRHLLAALGALAALPAAARDDDLLEDWVDTTRVRALPVRIRLPETTRPAPVLLISHGLGGSRDGLAYLGEAAAAAGFAAIHLQHPGTDSTVLGGPTPRLALAAAALDVRGALDRLLDGIFALDEVIRRNRAAGALHGRLDTTRIAMAGHSYGAWTVQHMIGQRLPGGDRGLNLPDPRIKAAIALSPLPPRGLPRGIAFARVATPLLSVTGTEDRGYIDGTTPDEREIPFRAIAGVPQGLAVLAGASHASFAGEPDAAPRWNEPTYHARAAGLAMAFLRAVMLGDTEAARLLREGAPGLLQRGDRLELKDFARAA